MLGATLLRALAPFALLCVRCALSGATCETSGLSNASCAAKTGPLLLSLQSKEQQSPDSWLLRFSLPPTSRHLGADPLLPTCIKVAYNGTNLQGEPTVLKKSYSPVSHPGMPDTVDLLVKAYPWRPLGGVGAYLCDRQVGDVIQAKLKPERVMHGSAEVLGRWDNVGLVGGGTGVAPLIQIVRLLLDDNATGTKVHFLSIHRREEDILMRDALDELAKRFPSRLAVRHSLTAPPPGWMGLAGRGSAEMARQALPPPTGDGRTMVLVCGTDGFVETWGGPVERAKTADGSKGPKVQGPLLGVLAAAGYAADEVFKY